MTVLRPEVAGALSLADHHRRLAERWVRIWCGRERRSGRCKRHLDKANRLALRAEELAAKNGGLWP